MNFMGKDNSEDKGFKDSLDIEFIPKREVREYTVKRKSYYTQKKQYDKQGNLEQEIWEREDSLGNIIILDGAAYISKGKYEQLIKQNLSPSGLIESAKKEKYTGHDGLIVLLYKEKIYYSSEVVSIEPPFGEFPIDV